MKKVKVVFLNDGYNSVNEESYRPECADYHEGIVNETYINRWRIFKRIFHLFAIGCSSIFWFEPTLIVIYVVIYLCIWFCVAFLRDDFETWSHFPRLILHLWYKIKSKDGFVFQYMNDKYLSIISRYKTNKIYYVYSVTRIEGLNLDSDIESTSGFFEELEEKKNSINIYKLNALNKWNTVKELNERDKIFKKNLLKISKNC